MDGKWHMDGGFWKWFGDCRHRVHVFGSELLREWHVHAFRRIAEQLERGRRDGCRQRHGGSLPFLCSERFFQHGRQSTHFHGGGNRVELVGNTYDMRRRQRPGLRERGLRGFITSFSVSIVAARLRRGSPDGPGRGKATVGPSEGLKGCSSSLEMTGDDIDRLLTS